MGELVCQGGGHASSSGRLALMDATEDPTSRCTSTPWVGRDSSFSTWWMHTQCRQLPQPANPSVWCLGWWLVPPCGEGLDWASGPGSTHAPRAEEAGVATGEPALKSGAVSQQLRCLQQRLDQNVRAPLMSGAGQCGAHAHLQPETLLWTCCGNVRLCSGGPQPNLPA
jgi:hypothetical protein